MTGLRTVWPCICPHCNEPHKRIFSEDDIVKLPVKDGKVEAICAKCIWAQRFGWDFKNDRGISGITRIELEEKKK